MKVYTYSEARQRLAKILEEARSEGAVGIRRRDGSTFLIKPETTLTSPLDVEGVDTDVSKEEIIAFIREGRERTR